VTSVPVRLAFRPITRADFPLLHEWLARPHVAEWWDGVPTPEEVEADFGPMLNDSSTTRAYIVLGDDTPIGYIQSYVALGSGEGWWERETDPGVRGIDQFLAEPGLLGQGIGRRMIRQFVADLSADPAVTRIQIDPSPTNFRAIRCYRSAGFVPVGRIDTPDGPALYMIWERAGGPRWFLEAAINGSRRRSDHPALPLTAAEQARDAAACRASGAMAVHLHVRDDAGLETLAAASMDTTLRAMRAAAPGLAVGVSTGMWIVPEPAARLALVREWGERPDFASVNFDEPGAAELAETLLGMGVGIEGGLATASAARTLVRSRLASRCLRFLIEPQEPSVSGALATVASIERVLDSVQEGVPRLLHGVEATAWPLLAEAPRRDYQVRIGLEDTLRLPNGRPAPDNASLVAAARGALTEIAATPESTSFAGGPGGDLRRGVAR
jgi:uncharacterized protein (DUF849 family)/RimJ/RimL family protein N-acetyltransferase